MVNRDELVDLVDTPNETLAVEYKSWMDLSDNVHRADLARHIAAIANYGGGNIVFGFADDMTICGPNPHAAVPIDRDTVSSIVRKYLEPNFQCDVRTVTSASNTSHPVITVPSHGAVPICAKAGGPLVSGRPQGIISGTYYMRVGGPASEGITSPSDWAPLIRRCAMHDRSAILAAVNAAISDVQRPTADRQTDDVLKKWHNAAHTVFMKDATGLGLRIGNWAQAHMQLSYQIEYSKGDRLDENQMVEILRQVNSEVGAFVQTGWSMMHIFGREEIAPRFTTDPNSGLGERDFLECAHLRQPPAEINAADMWRVSNDGLVTLIREYWEDSSSMAQQSGRPAGSWFSPNLMVRSLGEFIHHARALSARLDAPTHVSFRCEWFGLEGREVHDPYARWYKQGFRSREGHRTSVGRWPVGALENEWPKIIVALTAPVARLFDVNEVINESWVRARAQKWATL